eukprot:CAMPEP_0198211772 /NCGR_PEP_ID=MMETSP1445-20131203/25329_1 /TAXON_ID=36898 /ORGANISM="Pyramimonas sp., Strain CCMP2087" /LENGTH=291 /DNA_ID=CAMNT_0043886105 /DNA_START=75 /DNA_END=950 /DNA_ORIENTATION=+
MAQITQALAGIALTPLSGHRQSVSRTRNASSARRSVTCKAAKEENEAVKNRTNNQKALAGVDGAIRNARDDLGKSIMKNFDGPLKMLGIGKKNPNQKKTGLAQWEEQRMYLLANTKSVSASEVKDLMEKGYVFLDVRPRDEFEAFRPAGARGAALYQNIEGASVKQNLRKTLFMMQAVKPIEENPEFLEQVKALVGKAPGVVVGCGAGGTTKSTTNFPSGQPSRSLLAIYRILSEGVCPEAVHLIGGLNSWFREGYEGEGAEDNWDDTSGRTPFVAGYTPVQDSDELKANQ